MLEMDRLSFLGGVGDTLSCVAKAEPRKRLCGITVAPIIPIAKEEAFYVIVSRSGTRALTRIQTPSLKDFTGGEISKERLTPIHLYLYDNNEHTNQNRKDLCERITSIIRYWNGSKVRSRTDAYHSGDEPFE